MPLPLTALHNLMVPRLVAYWRCGASFGLHARTKDFESLIHSIHPLKPPLLFLTQKNQDDTITPEEHFADESVLIDAFGIALGLLRPHLLHILQHHVAVAVERLDSRKKFSVIPA